MLELQRRLEEQKKLIKLRISRHLTEDALNRLDNIIFSNPVLGEKLLSLLHYMIETGQITKELTDNELKSIVKSLIGEKRETKIRRL